ncbi:MAG: DUF6323 family protein [Clostridiales bacterium]|nr:DUF6323 family protein [Clostridiales bacterium]
MNEQKNVLAHLLSEAAPARQTERLLACNGDTAAYGLRLTPQQAQALEQTRQTALRETGRIELDGGMTDKLIRAFCSSPYVTQETWEETLHALLALFYAVKNELPDRMGDDAVLSCMRRAFDGPCRGSLELLAGEAMPALIRRWNRRAAGPAERMEATDD